MATSPLLELHALVKHYGRTKAVDGVSFAVGPGEIVGLLGSNGAGKTTTLECVLGLRVATSGTVRFEDAELRPASRCARLRLGVQLQPPALQDKITPREALAFAAACCPEPADVPELLARFGLTAKADAPFDTLSTGQRQRLAVALAFVNRPTLLVLDEPTTGLDPQTRRALHEILVAHRAAGGAVLLSTHDLDEAQRLCDRVVLLHRGRVVADDTPPGLIARAGVAAGIRFSTARPLSAESLQPLALRATAGDTTLLRTNDPVRSLVALTGAVQRERNELTMLQLQPPSLEDAFLALTGEQWDQAEGTAP